MSISVNLIIKLGMVYIYRGSHDSELLTWHIREHENALVKTKREEISSQLLEDGHAHTEGEAAVTHQHRVPEMVDFRQRKNVCKMRNQNQTVDGKPSAFNTTYE